MRHRIYSQSESQDAFTDLLFNALLGFAFMFVVAFSLISDPSDTGKVDRKAEPWSRTRKGTWSGTTIATRD